MAKIWEKNIQVDAKIEAFTVGRDREMDVFLAKYDVLGSMAHITMLESVGLLQKDELGLFNNLQGEVKNLYIENALIYGGNITGILHCRRRGWSGHVPRVTLWFTQQAVGPGDYGRRAPDTPEKTILRLARSNKGQVTPGEVAIEGDLSVDEARKELDKLAKQGMAELRVRSSGVIVYFFPEFAESGSSDFVDL